MGFGRDTTATGQEGQGSGKGRLRRNVGAPRAAPSLGLLAILQEGFESGLTHRFVLERHGLDHSIQEHFAMRLRHFLRRVVTLLPLAQLGVQLFEVEGRENFLQVRHATLCK